MDMLIKVSNGVPVESPVLESNLVQAIGCIPEGYERFVTCGLVIDPPLYHRAENPIVSYKHNGEHWVDYFIYEPMNEEEKASFRDNVEKNFRDFDKSNNFTAWVMDEELGKMVPPIPKPIITEDDPRPWKWCGAENSWKKAAPMPEDGNAYYFDFVSWQWAAVTELGNQ